MSKRSRATLASVLQASSFLLDVAPRIGLGAAVVATIVGISAIVLAVRRSEHASAAVVATAALAATAPALGLVALAMALHSIDPANAAEGPGTRARLAAAAYDDGTLAARRGAIGAGLPLLLASLALVVARKHRPMAWLAAVLATSTAGAAWLGASKPGPVDPGPQKARLMDARALVDVDRTRGCDALARAVTDDFQWNPMKGPLPPEVPAAVPDYAAVATKCARWALAEGRLGADGTSPLLVDDAFRKEVTDDVDLQPCTFGCGGDDDFGGYGVIGLPPKRNEVRFLTTERTETGPTDYPPDVLLRVVGRAPTRMRLRSCPEAGRGNVTVRLTIEPSGKVASVTSEPLPSAAAGPPLADPALIACVVRAMGTLTFPPPEGTVTITFPVGFAPAK